MIFTKKGYFCQAERSRSLIIRASTTLSLTVATIIILFITRPKKDVVFLQRNSCIEMFSLGTKIFQK
ncbi:MAG: hypothetical protein Q4C98_09630 [Capnocytophaga sp.]|nr:hypothetical protein [Capnocytophaga sp.]